MIRVIPDWLQEVVDFINQEFPNQQNIYHLDMDEEDTERFAEQMNLKFMAQR